MRAVLPFIQGAGRFGVAAQALRRTRRLETSNFSNKLVYRVNPVRNYASEVDHHQQKTPKQEDEENLLQMDLLPTPEKPWAVGLREQQAYYNRWLAAGVASLLGSIAFGYWHSGYWMYDVLENPKEWYQNPPLFTLKDLKAEAAAALAAADEEAGEEEVAEEEGEAVVADEGADETIAEEEAASADDEAAPVEEAAVPVEEAEVPAVEEAAVVVEEVAEEAAAPVVEETVAVWT